MTPLFWLNVVFGKVQKIEAINELAASPRMPPRMRCQYFSPVVASPDRLLVAVRSPTDSIIEIRKIGKREATMTQSTLRGNRATSGTKRGSSSDNREKSVNPRNCAAISPTTRPIEMLLRRTQGLPKRVAPTIVRNTREASNKTVQPPFAAST